jgi:molybdopterin-binding protein
MTVDENIQYGLDRTSESIRRERSDAILESFRIAHLRTRKPREISGGERQRVALARALVTDPCVLLLDEPLAAIDGVTKSKIVDDLRAWNQSHGIPILYITHSRDEVFALGERVLVLENGRIVAEGTPHEVMSAPRQETVAQLAGFENILEATVVSANASRGTMTCRLSGSNLDVETPLVRAAVGTVLNVGIRAGDILLATIEPVGLSARNLIPGRVASLNTRDVIVEARINCGIEIVVHLTLAARDALQLQPGKPVWLVVKTHSCHLMA